MPSYFFPTLSRINRNLNSLGPKEFLYGTDQLKDKYRLVLTMYLLEGFDHQEISEILKITETTSRTHLLRGKRLLKEQLKNTGYAEGY